MSRVFVLGASDPEMAEIETLLAQAGEKVVYAMAGGVRVAPAHAYRCDPVEAGTHFVECAPAVGRPAGAVVIDHHRPGDPGFGRGPKEFLPASSIGQVLKALDPEGPMELRGGCWVYGGGARLVPPVVVWTAAGDHCPGAAYRGECPGVNPDALMEYRAAGQAAFRRTPVEVVLAEVGSATAAIKAAPRVVLWGVEIADLRPGTVPSLPEASLRLGVPVIYQMMEKDGRRKVGILGAGEGTPAGSAPVAEFIRTWGPAQGLTGMYGDPVRGFAGGYFFLP
jgi:hypothetical protein